MNNKSFKCKHSQANIIVLVLIITMVLIAFLVIYNVVKPLISEKSENIASSYERLQLMNSLTVNNFNQIGDFLEVTVSRDSSPGDFSGIRFTVNTDETVCYIEQAAILNTLETKTFYIDMLGYDCFGVVQSVSAQPLFSDFCLDLTDSQCMSNSECNWFDAGCHGQFYCSDITQDWICDDIYMSMSGEPRTKLCSWEGNQCVGGPSFIACNEVDNRELAEVDLSEFCTCYSEGTCTAKQISLPNIPTIEVTRNINSLGNNIYRISLNIDVDESNKPNAFIISENYPVGWQVLNTTFGGIYNTTMRLNNSMVEWLASNFTELKVEDRIVNYTVKKGNISNSMLDKPTSFSYDNGGNPINTYEPPSLASDENWNTSIYVQDGSAYSQIILYENWDYLPDFANGIKLKSKYRFDCYYADSYSASVGLSCWDYNANKWALIKNYVCSPNDVLYEQKTVTNNILSGCIKLNNPIKIKTYLNGESNSDAVYFYENAIYTDIISYLDNPNSFTYNTYSNPLEQDNLPGLASDENWNTALKVMDGGAYNGGMDIYENWSWMPEFASGVKLKSKYLIDSPDSYSGWITYYCFNYSSTAANKWARIINYNTPNYNAFTLGVTITVPIPSACISADKPISIKTSPASEGNAAEVRLYENAIGYSSNLIPSNNKFYGAWMTSSNFGGITGQNEI